MDIKRTDVRQRKQRRLLLAGSGAVLVMVLLIGIFSSFASAVPSVERGGVVLDSVRRGGFLRTVRGSGVLVPKESRWIASETAARVDHILIKPGAKVSADAVILELVDPEVENQLLTANASVLEGKLILRRRKRSCSRNCWTSGSRWPRSMRRSKSPRFR